MPTTNRQQNESDTDVTYLQQLAQTCQKLCEDAHRASKDETNPVVVRLEKKGEKIAFELMADVIRGMVNNITLKAPVDSPNMLLQIYRMSCELGRQQRDE